MGIEEEQHRSYKHEIMNEMVRYCVQSTCQGRIQGVSSVSADTVRFFKYSIW